MLEDWKIGIMGYWGDGLDGALLQPREKTSLSTLWGERVRVSSHRWKTSGIKTCTSVPYRSELISLMKTSPR